MASGLDGVAVLSAVEAFAVLVLVLAVVVGSAEDIFFCSSAATARRYSSARVRLDSATRWA